MAKKDLQEEAIARGIKITGDETIPVLEKLLKESAEVEAPEKAPEEVKAEKAETPKEATKETSEPELSVADQINAAIADVKQRHAEWLRSIGR